jgi:hypothetical protein
MLEFHKTATTTRGEGRHDDDGANARLARFWSGVSRSNGQKPDNECDQQSYHEIYLFLLLKSGFDLSKHSFLATRDPRCPDSRFFVFALASKPPLIL